MAGRGTDRQTPPRRSLGLCGLCLWACLGREGRPPAREVPGAKVWRAARSPEAGRVGWEAFRPRRRGNGDLQLPRRGAPVAGNGDAGAARAFFQLDAVCAWGACWSGARDHRRLRRPA